MGIARGVQEATECALRGDGQENAGKTLYRGMQETPDGEPAISPSARTLGARPHVDISVDPLGRVHPGTGGMSVAPDTPSNLPRHRRPPEYGGTGKDHLWSIQERDLSVHLRYVADAIPVPTHGSLSQPSPCRSQPINRP